jgi:hypothetical protein
MLKSIASDIIQIIKSYIYVQCSECEVDHLQDDVLFNTTTIYYREIFNDDFPFPRIYKTHPVLCKNCIENLKKEFIKPL